MTAVANSGVDVPVAIVGGGGTGLCAAMFLSQLGVKSVLFERHPSTSILPKAHVINQRSMEIFREHGFEHHVLENGAPLDCMDQVAWYTSIGGDGPLDRKLIYKTAVRGGGRWKRIYEADSPCRVGNLPQLRLEPLLRQHVEAQGIARLLFDHEVTSVREEGRGVVLRYDDRKNGASGEIRASYVVVADGGKTIGTTMGVELEGPRNLVDNISVHFAADLSKWMNADGALSRWYIDPEAPVGGYSAGVIVPMGPKHWDNRSEEWVFHFGLHPDDPLRKDDSPEAIVPRMLRLMKLPDLQPKVLKISHWLLEGVLANKYRVGRVAFAGDAVHRHPPNTGLGLNTGIQDAYNLAWKLAAIVQGHAAPGLLDSYEPERLPVGRRNVDWAMFTATGPFITEAAMGIIKGAGARNKSVLERYFADTYDGRARRKQVAEIFDAVARREFCSHELDLDVRYCSAAVVDDGSSAPESTGTGNEYVPSTRPGHRMPHVQIEIEGKRVSTLDVVGRGRFVVFAGADGARWIEAAQAIAAARGLPLVAFPVPTDADESIWPWDVVRGVDADGAVLVRPDGHVGWRSKSTDSDPAEASLGAALDHILGRVTGGTRSTVSDAMVGMAETL